MFKIIRLTVLFAITFCASCNVSKDADSYNLKMRLSKGDKFTQTVNTEMNMEVGGVSGFSMFSTTGNEYEVLDSTSDGQTLKCTFTQFNYEVKSGIPDVNKMLDSTGRKNMKELIGMTTTLKVKNDSLVGIIHMDPLPETGDSVSQAMVKNMLSEDNLKKMFNGLFDAYPAKSVKIGDSWTSSNSIDMMGMTLIYNTKYTLESVKDQIAEILVKGSIVNTGSMEMNGRKIDIQLQGDQKGNVFINLDNGYPVKGKTEIIIETVKKDIADVMPMKIKTISSFTE